MKQVILKSNYDLGWGSTDYRASFDGYGLTPSYVTFGPDSPKVVVPINGTFSNLIIYSPTGQHPAYTATLLVNGIATALSCGISAIEDIARDSTHSINVVAGDDVCMRVSVNPFGSGVGYPFNFSIEFEGTEQFYGIGPSAGGQTVDSYNIGGALGNGIFQVLSSPTELSNTYSICTCEGNITGIRMKNYSTLNVGGRYEAFIVKNKVPQMSTMCTLIDGTVQAFNTFSLPIDVGDRIDIAIVRRVNTNPFSLAQTAVSVSFTPNDPLAFMSCGGNNNAINGDVINYMWVQSKQQGIDEEKAKCPVTPRGLVITGLHIESLEFPPTIGRSRVVTLRKNGIDTLAVVTLSDMQDTATINGLHIPYLDGDFINLEHVPIGNPITGLRFKWGLAMRQLVDMSGLYYINPVKAEKHDSYYGDHEQKIPNPTVKTALIGE